MQVYNQPQSFQLIQRFLHCLVTTGCILGLASGTAIATPKITITENEIRYILEQVNLSTLNQDVDGICAWLAEDATIEYRSSFFFGNYKFNVSQYKDYLKKQFGKLSHYDYQSKILEITIAEDGQSHCQDRCQYRVVS